MTARNEKDDNKPPRPPRGPPAGGRLGILHDIERDLKDAEDTATDAGRGSLVKARADLIALFHYAGGVGLLDRAGRHRDITDDLATAADLVRRGVSGPRVARILALDMGSETVRNEITQAEDLRTADMEIALFSRVLFDSAAGAVSCLKAWREELEETAPTARREISILDAILDDPEIVAMVVRRYGHALGPKKDATVQ